MMFNGFSELPITISRLPVFYKQRDNFFYPAWAWSISSWILRVPYSIIEAVVWSCVVYYTVGFAPGVGRYVFPLNFLHIGSPNPANLFTVFILLFQVFPVYAIALCSAPNGIGSFPYDGYNSSRHGRCKYFWVCCLAGYILTEWIYYSKV